MSTQRTIKFRAWHKHPFKGWVMSEVINIEFSTNSVNTKDGSFPQMRDDKLLKLMQFTGLTDCKGVEIYEHDIVKGWRSQQGKPKEYGWEEKDVVRWNNGGFRIFSKCMQQGHTKENNLLYQFMWHSPGHLNIPDSYWQIDDIEVVGNIFANPNLTP